ncbi:YopX family protein [Streptococcus uberis]|uniref:YopX family protein n=1 Tax=Streptococcus uberis TaxID=1349 RepID=UPI003D6BD4DA
MITKFRAWDKHNKKMFTNDQIIIWNGNVYANDSGKLSVERLRGWSVDGKYLIQSTGLFDKNGVEIFEGDILEVTDTSLFGGNYRGAIVYLERWGVYGFSLLDAKVISTNEFDKHSIGFLMKEFGSCFTLAEASRKSNFSYKVIGNIYQNSDLLESVEE